MTGLRERFRRFRRPFSIGLELEAESRYFAVSIDPNPSDGMAEIVRMPLLSDTMTEGTIVKWHKKEGDAVKAGDILAEVETDKATMELESYWDGILLHIAAKEGDTVPVDGLIAIIGEAGEDISDILAQAEPKAAPSPETPAKAEDGTAPPPTETPAPSSMETTDDDRRLKASPLARKIAREKGIDLRALRGSGPGGRIIKRDVEAARPAAAPTFLPPEGAAEGYEDVPLSSMRKAIARRLSESKFSAPHYYLSIEVAMDRVMAARAALKERLDVKVSVNDFIIKAAALALRKHPEVNSSWMGDQIRIFRHVHIGVAVAVPDGLVVPVVRHADRKPLGTIAAEVRELAAKAREKKISVEELEGATFSISNLGMFGIDHFTAIINPPNSAIMAVGRAKVMPVFNEELGDFEPALTMKVTLSCDHRVIDGAVGAAFLQTFKTLLEEPALMIA